MQAQPQSSAQQQNTAMANFNAIYQRLPPAHRARLDMVAPERREEAMKVLLNMLRNKHNSDQMITQQQPGGMSVATPGSVPGQPMGQPMGQPGMGMGAGNPFAGRPPAMFPTGQPAPPGASGMMGFTPQQMAMGGLPFGRMHNRTPSAGSNPMANVSPSVMQSFMQRNPDPSNPGM